MFKTISGRNRARTFLIYIASMIALICLLAPIYWTIASSFQKEIELYSRPPHLIPTRESLTLGHYKFLFTGEFSEDSKIMLQAGFTIRGIQILPAIGNSIIIALFVTLINVVVGFPSGHAFARYRFWADRQILLTMLATRLMPSISIVIPAYILLRTFGLLDTKQALVAFHSAMTLPFTIWIIRAYFHNIPIEYEEAARMDGCGYFRTLTRVVLPMAIPGLIAAAIFAFMYSYSEFIVANVLTQTLQSRTQTVILAHISRGTSTAKGLISATGTLAMIPPILIAIVFRKQILEGLTARLGL